MLQDKLLKKSWSFGQSHSPRHIFSWKLYLVVKPSWWYKYSWDMYLNHSTKLCIDVPGVQLEFFQGKGGLVGLGHFYKYNKRSMEGKI